MGKELIPSFTEALGHDRNGVHVTGGSPRDRSAPDRHKEPLEVSSYHLKPTPPSPQVQLHFMEIQEAEEIDTDHRHATGKVPAGDTQPGFLHGGFKEIKRRWGGRGRGRRKLQPQETDKHVSPWLPQTNTL